MMVLSHSVKTGICFIFLALQMRRFFFYLISFLFAEARATFASFFFFCFAAWVVSVLSKPECVYLRVLVKQLVTFALPSAAEAGRIQS